MTSLFRRLVLGALLLGVAALGTATPALAAQRVVTTTPDLAALAARVGGEAVEVESLVKGPQDPHFVQARPSAIRRLHDADVFVRVGLDLEVGWAPALLRSARNPDILPGAPGHVDASRAIRPLDVPGAPIDRGAGDVHPYGNPHYLTDPLNGLRVARLLRDVFARLDPPGAEAFAERTRRFERELLTALAGEGAAARFAPDALVAAIEAGRVEELLGGPPGGWLGAMAPHAGTKVVQDHRVFPYFARRFGLEPVLELEPRPGIAPTTAHLARVVEAMRSAGIRLVLASPYFDPRHARRVAERTGATVVTLAHQTGAVEGAEGYLGTIDRNVRVVAEALGR